MKKGLIILLTICFFVSCTNSRTHETNISEYVYDIDDRTLITSINYDIDKDGITEQCFLHYGPTYGIFTFIFTVESGDSIKYQNLFECPHGVLSFVEIEGDLKLCCNINIGEIGTLYYDISVNEYNIILSENDVISA